MYICIYKLIHTHTHTHTHTQTHRHTHRHRHRHTAAAAAAASSVRAAAVHLLCVMVATLEGRLLQALCNRLSSVLDAERVDAHAARQHAAAPCLRQYLYFYTTSKASKLSTEGVDAHAARQHAAAASSASVFELWYQ